MLGLTARPGHKYVDPFLWGDLSMKVTLIAGLISLAAAVPFSTVSAGPSNIVDNKQVTAQAVMTDQLTSFVDQEVRRRELALQLAPIKSSSDLATYLRITPKAASPLNRLSPGAQRRFLKSLTFNENGLTGYEYVDLVAELPAAGIYNVLGLFGAQHTTSLLKGVRVLNKADVAIMSSMNNSPMLRAADYEGYRCESRATCAENMHTICMSAC